jgi:iron(III) transport system permease protein
VWAGSALGLLLLVLLPLGWLFATSLSGANGPSFAWYLQIARDQGLLKAVKNTLVISTWVGVLASATGACVGWLVSRTDLPFRRLIRTLVIVSFVTPPFLGAFAWEMLAGPNAGLVNKWYRMLSGSQGPLFNIYTEAGLVFVMTLYTFPYASTMIANALELVPADMEDAAAILGAGRLRTAATITLPLVAPAVVGAFILAFLHSMALFGSPAILAMPAGMHTITTQIWVMFTRYPPQYELASALSVCLLLITMLLVAGQRWLLGRRGYAALSGRSTAWKVVPLGRWRAAALGFCLGILALAMFLPYGVLFKAAFAKAWAMPLTGANFTWNNWPLAISGYSATRQAITNTLKLGVLTATVGALFAAVIAYVVNRRLLRAYRAITVVVMAPLVIPGIVLAVGLLMAYSRPPLFLYGTIWILFVAYVTKEIPVGFSQIDATMKGVHEEFEEAARILGADRLRVLAGITLPLARSGVVAAWCLMFIGAIRELSSSILLFTPRSWVLSVVIIDLRSNGVIEVVSVLSILLLAVTIVTVMLVQRIAGRPVFVPKE